MKVLAEHIRSMDDFAEQEQVVTADFLIGTFQIIDAIHLARVQLRQPDAGGKLADIAELMLTTAKGLMESLQVRQQQLTTLRERGKMALDALEGRYW